MASPNLASIDSMIEQLLEIRDRLSLADRSFLDEMRELRENNAGISFGEVHDLQDLVERMS